MIGKNEEQKESFYQGFSEKGLSGYGWVSWFIPFFVFFFLTYSSIENDFFQDLISFLNVLKNTNT